MPSPPWKPLIVLSRSLSSPRSMANKVLELQGHPGVHGFFTSSAWLSEQREVILKAFRKARLKLYVEPSSLYGLRYSTDILRHYEDMGVAGLVIPCAHPPEIFAALAKAETKLKLILEKGDVDRLEQSVNLPLDQAFRLAAGRQPFDGVAFGGEEPQPERPATRGSEPLMVCQYIGSPEESSATFAAGATHLLIPEGLFSSPRAWADRFWPVVQSLNPGGTNAEKRGKRA